MNLLVTGSYGQLGKEMMKIASHDKTHQWFFTDIDTLDISDADAVEDYFSQHHIEYCINCAAYTAVDRAEDDEALARKVNVTAVQNLALSCQKHQATLIHISTDYVFDGMGSLPYREDDPTGPVSVYGKTKLEGEEALKATGCKSIIVRTAWLYSSTGKNFVKTMLQLAQNHDSINVVCDQKGTPTWAGDLASTLMLLIQHYGTQTVHETFHFTNEGVTTWDEFARAIFEIAHQECQVHSITTYQYPTRATRPAYSVLDKTKIKTVLGMDIPCWKDSLAKCIEELNKTT